jgi:hypothetical protein
MFMEGDVEMVGFTADTAHERAQSVLAESPLYALRLLQVEPRGDALLIRGRVSSYYHKQLAQEAVRSVANGIELINSVHVG